MTTGPPFHSVHHVGVSVTDMSRSVAFWRQMLGQAPRDRRVLEGPQLGSLVGYPGIRIDSCWFDLPGGVSLELLEYLDRSDAPYDPATAHPGNVHVCLQVRDMTAAHRHALECGAHAVSDQPIEVRAGPNAGARLAYLRDPDGVTVELFQAPGPPPEQ